MNRADYLADETERHRRLREIAALLPELQQAVDRAWGGSLVGKGRRTFDPESVEITWRTS